MDEEKNSPYRFGPDAPDLAHQLIGDAYRRTGDPDFRWAQEALHEHARQAERRESSRLLQEVVSADQQAASNPRIAEFLDTLDPVVWRPYAEYLLSTKDPLPLDAKHMMELSIAATAVLHQRITSRIEYGGPLPDEMAQALHLEFWSGQTHYQGNGKFDPHKYDRDAVPLLLVDRPRLYSYLASMPSNEADRLISQLAHKIEYLHANIIQRNQQDKFKTGDFTINWQTKTENEALHDFAKTLEEFVPASREEERRLALNSRFYHYDRGSNRHNVTQSFVEALHSPEAPLHLQNPIDLAPYVAMLQQDRENFRYDAINAKARPQAPTSLLDLMGLPEVEGEKVRRLLESRAESSPRSRE